MRFAGFTGNSGTGCNLAEVPTSLGGPFKPWFGLRGLFYERLLLSTPRNRCDRDNNRVVSYDFEGVDTARFRDDVCDACGFARRSDRAARAETAAGASSQKFEG